MTGTAPSIPTPRVDTPESDAGFDRSMQRFVGDDPAGRLGNLLSARLATGERDTPGAGIDATWCEHDSPVGRLLLVLNDRAVVRVAFEKEGFDAVLDDLGRRLGPRTVRAARPADTLRRELDDYFIGERAAFTVMPDLRLSTAPFRRIVQARLPSIGYGTTASYAAVARGAGRPNAVRAVGSACATNPLPIVLPCHRVVRSDGSLGNYLGGLEAKRFLIAHERTHRSPAGAATRAGGGQA